MALLLDLRYSQHHRGVEIAEDSGISLFPNCRADRFGFFLFPYLRVALVLYDFAIAGLFLCACVDVGGVHTSYAEVSCVLIVLIPS